MRKYKLQYRNVKEEFEKRTVKNTDTDCWNWIGTRSPKGGYGIFTCKPADIFKERAHYSAWKLYKSDIEPNQRVLHSCDDSFCVNPDHLFLSDKLGYAEYRVSKGRHNRGEQHGTAKLTEPQVLAIIADDRLGRVIADEYNIAKSTVCDIKRGRSWSHLPRS